MRVLALNPSSLEGRDDCLLCHKLDGVKPFSADHEGRASHMRRACHKPGEAREAGKGEK